MPRGSAGVHGISEGFSSGGPMLATLRNFPGLLSLPFSNLLLLPFARNLLAWEFLPSSSQISLALTWEESGVAPANQTKERAKKKSSWISPIFVNSGVFSLGKQARFTLNFCSGMPLRKVHELTFLWLGLPRPLLKENPCFLFPFPYRQGKEDWVVGGRRTNNSLTMPCQFVQGHTGKALEMDMWGRWRWAPLVFWAPSDMKFLQRQFPEKFRNFEAILCCLNFRGRRTFFLPWAPKAH